MTGYVLTSAAEADLRGIVRYTRKQWGEEQVRRYISTLEKGISNLAEGRGVFRDMSALFPDLRLGHYGQHYVFCLPRSSAPALIVAILHERMDLMRRLSERLKDGWQESP